MKTIEVRSIKVTIALKLSELPTDLVPANNEKIVPVDLAFQCENVVLTANINGRSYKKAVQGGDPNAFAVIQGKLGENNQILQCGLTVQPPKADKPAEQ